MPDVWNSKRGEISEIGGICKVFQSKCASNETSNRLLHLLLGVPEKLCSEYMLAEVSPHQKLYGCTLFVRNFMQIRFAKILRIWQVFRVFNTNLPFITCFHFQTVKYSDFVFWGKNQHFWTHKWKFKSLLLSEFWLDISKYALDWEDFYRVRESNT